jgi:hypothetical protein
MLSATVVLALLIPTASAVAQEKEKDFQVSGAAGWGGRTLRGEPAPVLIDLDNRGKKDVDIVVAVTWAAPYTYQSQGSPSIDSVFGRTGPVHQIALTLPAKSRKRVSLTMTTPDMAQSSVWAYMLDGRGGKILAQAELQTRTLEPNKRIVGVVGSSRPDGIDDGTVEVANIAPDELPEEWQGYASLEALVWVDGRATEIRSAGQVDALRQWISSGGTFCVARGNTIDLAGTPIAELLPVKLGATRELDSLGGGNLPDGGTVVLETTLRKGAIRAESGGVPLVVETNRDAGRVIFAAFDPSRPPFTAWNRAKPFWKWLLSIGQAGPPPRQNEDLGSRVIGSRLLADQAGRFPDVAAPEIGGLFLLIILYLIVVGPLDYGLLRFFKKLEFTWFTFPAYVVLFTLFILLVGGAFIQRAAHQREIAVVDHYPETSFVRRRALSAVLAPADVLYKVEDAQPLSSNFINNERIYDTGSKVTDVRIQRGTTRSTENWLINRNFTGLAMADRCGTAPSPVTFTIKSQEKIDIQVAVKNATNETFETSVLVTAQGVYSIAAIPPGESTVSGSRLRATIDEFVDKEGQRAPRGDDANRFNAAQQFPAQSGDIGMKESDLNPTVKKALIGLSFGEPDSEHEILSGLARSLQAREWTRMGGSILLVWPQRPDPVVNFEPKPGRLTSVTLYRFFQGPPQ